MGACNGDGNVLVMAMLAALLIGCGVRAKIVCW